MPHPPTQIFALAKAASSLDLEAARARPLDASGDAGSAEELAASFPSRDQIIAADDPKAVRRMLVSLGLPGSGTPAKLQVGGWGGGGARAAGWLVWGRGASLRSGMPAPTIVKRVHW